MLPTEWLEMWDVDNDVYFVSPAEEPNIDAAVTRWIESNETRDTLLHLDLVSGTFLKIRASDVKSWRLSTPAARAMQEQINDSIVRDEDEEWKRNDHE